MAMWFYYDESGEKMGPFTSQQIKALALQSRISSETILETEDEKQAKASKVKGLFPAESQTSPFQSPINNDLIPQPSSQTPPISETPFSSNYSENERRKTSPHSFPIDTDSATTSSEKYNSIDLQKNKKDGYLDRIFNYIQEGGWKDWILNFKFDDIRLPVINLILTQIIYKIFIIATFLIMVIFPLYLGECLIEIAQQEDIPERFLLFFGFILGVLFVWLALICIIICVRLVLEYWVLFFDWMVSTKEAAKKYLNEK